MIDMEKLPELHRTVIMLVCVAGIFGTGWFLHGTSEIVHTGNDFTTGYLCGQNMPRIITVNGTLYNLRGTSLLAESDGIEIISTYVMAKLYYPTDDGVGSNTYDIKLDSTNCLAYINEQRRLAATSASLG